MPQPICHIITPVGMLGYGFDEAEFQTAIKPLVDSGVPTAIICDSGSTDSGPKKLASGETSCPRSSYKRDLGKILRAVTAYKVPLLVGSAGGAGLNSHVDGIGDVMKEIAEESSYSIKMLKIYADVSKDLISRRHGAGAIIGCGPAVPELTKQDINDCPVITSQMGPEPYCAAMERHPDFDVIVGGRTYDPAPYFAYAALCLKHHSPDYGKDLAFKEKAEGAIMHLGKIMECGALCAEPKGASAAGTVYADGSFDIAPTNPDARCTTASVAAHTLYEKSRPDILGGPGGWLDLTHSKYRQLGDGRTVRASGGLFKRSLEHGRPYQIKLEGARNRGFRSMYMGGIKDPILIKEIDSLLARVKGYVQTQHEGHVEGRWDLDLHVYGRDTSEIFLVAEALASTQKAAKSIANTARIATIHGPYSGQKANAGNFAFGICGTMEINVGPCAEFCVYHLMNLEPGEKTSLYQVEAKEMDYKIGHQPKGEHVKAGCDAKADAKDVTVPKQTQKAAPRSQPGGAVIDLESALTVGDVARTVRSKNAGPYEITLDVMFNRGDVFDLIKDSNMLTNEVIAGLFHLQTEQVIWCGFFDQAMAFKATIPRMRKGEPMASGGFMENDVHGSQMHVPLMEMKLPTAVRLELAALVWEEIYDELSTCP